MIKNDCTHKWRPSSSVYRSADFGIAPATFICENCSIEMTVAEVLQLEALENQTKLARHELGFQKWLSALAFIVSLIAVLITWLK